ncbi:hypothetical protein ACFLXE_00140 [Chloroflexota bacterium]
MSENLDLVTALRAQCMESQDLVGKTMADVTGMLKEKQGDLTERQLGLLVQRGDSEVAEISHALNALSQASAALGAAEYQLQKVADRLVVEEIS